MKVPQFISAFADIFREKGFEVYLIGGAVRDMIRGQVVEDFDFATNASPEEVMRLFRKVIPTGIHHGTVIVLFRGHSFEVTTYRIDGAYSDNRRPDSVTFTPSLEEDLKRRDFTINAIALDPVSGTLIDPHNGMSDIRYGVIRTVGNPAERFSEDALRMLRAIRFSCTLSFQIDPETYSSIAPEVHRIGDVSPERISAELQRMMASPAPSSGWRSIRSTGMIPYVLPEFDLPEDLFEHSIRTCDCAPASHEVLRWAALLHDIGKPECETSLNGSLHFPNHETVSAEKAEIAMRNLRLPIDLMRSTCHLIRLHMFDYNPNWNDGAVRRLIARVGNDYFDDLVALRLADHCGKGYGSAMPEYLKSLLRRRKSIITKGDPLTLKDLAVNGTNLIRECGLSPGRRIGVVLDELLQTCLDDPLQNERDTLLAIAQSFIDRHW